MSAAACDIRSATTGNEGNLVFSYSTVENLGDFNKPLAVGAKLHLQVNQGMSGPAHVVEASSDDPTVLAVTSFLGDTVEIEALSQGSARISVRAEVSGGQVVSDSVDMLGAEPARIALRHRYPAEDSMSTDQSFFDLFDLVCAPGEEAAYVAGSRIAVGYDMWSDTDQALIGFGATPVTWDPPSAMIADEVNTDPENLFFNLDATPETVLLSSTVDETSLILHLIEAEVIDGIELQGDFIGGEVPVESTRGVSVLPTTGDLRVCQYPGSIEVTATDTSICTVSGSNSNGGWGTVNVTGVAPGICEITVSFPDGGDDATGTFTVEIVEQFQAMR